MLKIKIHSNAFNERPQYFADDSYGKINNNDIYVSEIDQMNETGQYPFKMGQSGYTDLEISG